MELLELRVQLIRGLVLETDFGELGDDVRTGSGITLSQSDGTRRWRYDVGMIKSDRVDRAVDVLQYVVGALVIGG